MLNLITTISVGCFDTLNRGGKTIVYEKIVYLKNPIVKIPYIPVLKRHTSEIKKII